MRSDSASAKKVLRGGKLAGTSGTGVEPATKFLCLEGYVQRYERDDTRLTARYEVAPRRCHGDMPHFAPK